jgi:hypothetical protein
VNIGLELGLKLSDNRLLDLGWLCNITVTSAGYEPPLYSDADFSWSPESVDQDWRVMKCSTRTDDM